MSSSSLRPLAACPSTINCFGGPADDEIEHCSRRVPRNSGGPSPVVKGSPSDHSTIARCCRWKVEVPVSPSFPKLSEDVRHGVL